MAGWSTWRTWPTRPARLPRVDDRTTMVIDLRGTALLADTTT
jgi:hypothetical protein